MISWAPTAVEVKSLIPTRANSQPFSTTTTPTEAQVEQLIVNTAGEVVADVGPFDDLVVINPDAIVDNQQTLGDAAKWAVMLGTARMIEASFYPEENLGGGAEDTPAGRLHARYLEQLERLRGYVLSIGGGVDGEDPTPFIGSMETPLVAVQAGRRALDAEPRPRTILSYWP